MRPSDYLFSSGELRDYLDKTHAALKQEIDALPATTITGTEPEQLTNYFIEKYALTTPVLDETNITVEDKHTRIDVGQDPQRLLIDRSRPFYIEGTLYTHYVPFTGSEDLFQLRPSYYSSRFPLATVQENHLAFPCEDTRQDENAIKAAFADALNETKKLLAWAENDVRQYNEQITTTIRTRLGERRTKLLKDQAVVQRLGYPLRRREGAPNTYTVPVARKKIPLPPATPQAPEPAPITDEVYEDILGIIQNMASVLERSPNAFKDMKEEDLRTHFLVQLNGQYKGEGTAETFNGNGKTDILIRHENKNLFIAECKFWNGPKSLNDAIDQLLGYATWRDTKTSIILFNRNKNFTDVLQQIPGIVKAHPNFVQQHPYATETGFRCTLKQPDDPQRRLTLTILAFNIPT